MVEYSKGKLEEFLLSPRKRFHRHLFLIFVVIVMVVNMGYISPEANPWGTKRILLMVSSFLTFMLLFYGNIYWGVPRYLLWNRWGAYGGFIGLLSIILVLMTIFFQFLVFSDFQERVEENTLAQFSIAFTVSLINVALFSVGVSTVILFRSWMLSDRQVSELHTATLHTELDLLKNQINPHFLFNMLNNANVLLKREPQMARDVLFKLEELLRYQINDSRKELVSLDSELLFLQDFLQLEKIRRDKFLYQIIKDGDSRNIRIPPLLFIPFVENAVKYSQDSEEVSFINISFRIEEDSLLFLCLNSKSAKEQRKIKASGLGLKNIRRRLELLYPGKHTLEINEEEISYRVKLQIPLLLNINK